MFLNKVKPLRSGPASRSLDALSFFAIVGIFFVCHGLVSLVISPLQELILPEETVFVSLLYLPHGVRVLATWAYGWKSIPPLIIGAILASWFLRPSDELEFLEAVLLQRILVGALSAFLAFELFRFLGFSFYLGSSKSLDWKGLIAIGATASVFNSIGQILALSELIDLNLRVAVLIMYAIGDTLGLVACMVVLMFFFRWMRKFKRF